MTRSTFVGSILGYVGGLGPHFCRGVPWSPDIVPYKTGEQPTTLNAQGDYVYIYIYIYTYVYSIYMYIHIF